MSSHDGLHAREARPGAFPFTVCHSAIVTEENQSVANNKWKKERANVPSALGPDYELSTGSDQEYE